MDNVYVLQIIDPTYAFVRIVGIFESEWKAEIARDGAETRLTDEQYDRGCFYRITTYELGKLYH